MSDLAGAKLLLRERRYVVFPKKMGRRYFNDLGFGPATVFDIGVNNGTPWLYRSFPTARFVLVDPVGCMFGEPLPGRDSFRIEAGCGAEDGDAVISIANRNGRSSIGKRTALTNCDVRAERLVKIRRVDSIVREYDLQGPFGIKIDTEGHELGVLQGASGIMQDTLFIVAEVSVKKRFVNGYRFSDVVSYLRSHNFEFLDTLTPRRRPHAFADCLFARFDSPLFTGEK